VPTDHGFVFIRSVSATAFVLRALNPLRSVQLVLFGQHKRLASDFASA
jgi:hypothetical protein